MLRIDNNLLQEVGLAGLPDSEKNSLLRHIYETLEMRVGIRLADQMSNEQLDEFERYFEAKDDAGAFKWLETNFPNYKEIVQEEFEKLKAEVAQSAPQILSSSAQQAQMQPAAPMGAAVAANPTNTGYTPQTPQTSPLPPMQQGPQMPSQPPVPPMSPNYPVPRDINMPSQPPSMPTNPGSAPNYAYPQPSQPQPYSPPPQPQPPMPNETAPPFPDQQPPAGPGY